MSVRKYVGTRGTHWLVVLELGRDPATGKRKQSILRRDAGTGLPIPTKKRALEIEREELTRHRRGAVDPSTEPLRLYLERWLEETRDTRTPGTHYNWSSLIHARILPSLGDVPLNKVSTLQLQGFYRTQAAIYAASTLEVTRAVLSAALKAAVRWQLLERNPHDGVRLPRATTPERPVWTAEQTRTFLIHTECARWGPLWRLLIDSAMRIGEALALTWADVDWGAGTVRISKTVALGEKGNHEVFGRTKSASGNRTLALAPATVHALRRLRLHQHERRLALGGYWLDHDLIFDRHDGGRVDNSLIRLALVRDVAAAGLPRLTPHSLRHTSLTLAVAAGEPLHAVMRRAGHSSIAMTANLYGHMNQDADRRVSEALAKVLEG